MRTAALILIALISALHFYIAWFEIFAWTTVGARVFDMFPPEQFEQTKQLAANQGIYNAFLAVGLAWSLFIKDPKWQFNIAVSFLAFVVAAGAMAAVTVQFSSGLPQIVPACLALILLYLGNRTPIERN